MLCGPDRLLKAVILGNQAARQGQQNCIDRVPHSELGEKYSMMSRIT